MLLTNGVDEAIHLLACAFLDDGDEALICTPTFFMYDVSCSMMTQRPYARADGRLASRSRSSAFSLRSRRDQAHHRRLAQQSHGPVVSREHLLAIAAAAPHAVLMVDEAYFHFHGETLLDDVGRPCRT